MKEFESEHTYNLFYGLHDGQLKHISEVANGLKCHCVCPACNEKLMARNNGQKRIHHFAHYKSAECRYGVQTSIHIAAKQILEKSNRIKVPAVDAFINTEIEKDGFDEFISHGEFHNISSEKYVQIESVVLEKRLHRYIPDVVIQSGNKRLIIEIAVTHFVGRQKLQKIKTSEISALEIDLSSIQNDFNLNELEPLLIDNIGNKTWLHNQFAFDKTNLLRAKRRKEIDDKNAEEWQKKEQREFWYKGYYKPVIQRQVADDYIVPQIENCPLKKREYKGQYYASVNVDCVECTHSRWLREEDKFLICLYEYNINKGKKTKNRLKK